MGQKRFPERSFGAYLLGEQQRFILVKIILAIDDFTTLQNFFTAISFPRKKRKRYYYRLTEIIYKRISYYNYDPVIKRLKHNRTINFYYFVRRNYHKLESKYGKGCPGFAHDYDCPLFRHLPNSYERGRMWFWLRRLFLHQLYLDIEKDFRRSFYGIIIFFILGQFFIIQIIDTFDRNLEILHLYILIFAYSVITCTRINKEKLKYRDIVCRPLFKYYHIGYILNVRENVIPD